MGEVPGSIPGTALTSLRLLDPDRKSPAKPVCQGICGLVVEYAVAIGVTRVRFPADAILRNYYSFAANEDARVAAT